MTITRVHVGTAAPGCPVERSSTGSFSGNARSFASAGQPRAAVPTWFDWLGRLKSMWDNEKTSGESFPIQGHLITVDKNRFFFQHYGLTEHDLERYLAAALSAGGEYADLYFEYLSSTSLMVDESRV